MVATAERVGKVARIGGWVWVIRAMPELKRFFSYEVFPYVSTAQRYTFLQTEFLKPIFYHTCELPIWILRKLLLNGPIIIEQIVTSTYI